MWCRHHVGNNQEKTEPLKSTKCKCKHEKKKSCLSNGMQRSRKKENETASNGEELNNVNVSQHKTERKRGI